MSILKLGRKQVLPVIQKVEFGVYLGEEQEKVLLPKKQIPKDCEIGDEIEVFLYRDSMDRMIATVREPKITLDTLAVLQVKQVTKIGAFLDWGLEKDLFLPFKEQKGQVSEGEQHLVALYLDKSERLCATMKVYQRLSTDHSYQKGDMVSGTVYEVKRELGAFIAVDNRFHGLIPRREMHRKLKSGETIEARVTEVREDGKLTLSLNQPIHIQVEEDARRVLKVIEEYEGVLPYTEKASPEMIERDFQLSKNAFKRAVGRLLKENKIELGEKDIRLKK